MKSTNWIQFSWDLTALAPCEAELPEHYEISVATPDDEKEFRRVISSSFTLDPTWNPTMKEVTQTIDEWLDEASDGKTSVHLALRHGARIIGAAVVSVDSAAENHLSPGPCILVEYRNRGFGTRLLERSLTTLRDAGLPRACAIAKENSPVTKFLYTKFDSSQAPFDFSSALAA
jgi:N-acetylglutamate synthase-like GNAT family acetyltransferase